MSTGFHKLLKDIHHKAWGKSWPTRTCTIRRRDIFPDETGDDDEHMDIDDSNNDYDDVDNFDKETLTCLLDANLLQLAFEIPGVKFSAIIVCKEYEFLRELLEKEDGKSFIVTGQPGTGKTVFLLYLLLYRLQLALPTAVQFSPNEYIAFTADGVSVCTLDRSTDHWRMLPSGCWCLSDGNAEVMHPCKPFGREDLRTFLITPPRPDGYKRWRTHAIARTVITALPRAVEVAAIARVEGWKACDAISIMRKWGPCTRTILAILAIPAQEKDFRRYAAEASIDIYNDPSKVILRDLGQLPSGHGSTVLFICPIRSKGDPDYGDSKFIIPTMNLSEIFDIKSQGLSTEGRIRLYETFSMHPMTRGPGGWLHEKNMHLAMCVGSKSYKISNASSAKSRINSAALAPGGTVSALRAAACNRPSSFYWFPSVVNFLGIDSVLVNGNNIYALQATIADTYDRPLDGLRKIWQAIGAAAAQPFIWHFVIVTDNKPLADKYATELGTQLHDVALGRRRVRVSAWVCVLKS